jgi:hypothetical protein
MKEKPVKLKTILGLAWAAGSVWGQGASFTVRVYMNSATLLGRQTNMIRARDFASEILAGAGVTVEWRCGAPGPVVQPDTIEIQLGSTLPGHSDATLAYALPHQNSGVRIRVFMDRIAERYGRHSSEVLAGVS